MPDILTDPNGDLYTPLTEEEVQLAVASGFFSEDTPLATVTTNGCGIGPGFGINRFVRAALLPINDFPLRPQIRLSEMGDALSKVLLSRSKLWEGVRDLLLDRTFTNMDPSAIMETNLRDMPEVKLKRVLMQLRVDLLSGIEPILVNHNLPLWNKEHPNDQHVDGDFRRNIPKDAMPTPRIPDRKFEVSYDFWSMYPTDRSI